MRAFVTVILWALLSSFTTAGDSPFSYSDAKKIWDSTKARKEYQDYVAEFAQFNNHLHLDEKDGCYALAKGPVNLMLFITHQGPDEYAVIAQVLTDVDNAKAQCFKKSYRGVHTKTPPFFPFVLQMMMGG
jgi:hypothetical protein